MFDVNNSGVLVAGTLEKQFDYGRPCLDGIVDEEEGKANL